jgi:hypothetical protein
MALASPSWVRPRRKRGIGDALGERGGLWLQVVSEEFNYLGNFVDRRGTGAPLPVLDRFDVDAKLSGDLFLHEVKAETAVFKVFADRFRLDRMG